MYDEPEETLMFQEPAKALEAMKILFSKEADFRCVPLSTSSCWQILIFDPGRPFADDSKGSPSEVINSEHMGRVLAARKERENNLDEQKAETDPPVRPQTRVSE